MGLYLGLYSGQVSASITTYSNTPTSLRGTWYYNDGKGCYTRVRVTKTTVSQVNQRSGLAVSLKSSRVKLTKPNKYGYWRVNIKGYRPIVLKYTTQNGEPAIKGRFAGKAFSTGKPVFAYHYLPKRLPEQQWTSVPTQFQGSWAAGIFRISIQVTQRFDLESILFKGSSGSTQAYFLASFSLVRHRIQ